MFRNRISAAWIAAAASTACSAALGAPAKMDAIVQSGPGVEKMQLQSVDTPKPGANQVLMKVYAAGVNPVGSTAVDMVHGRGATVIASGHSSQGAWLKEQRVEDFVAYDKENVAARIKDVDAVLNMADGQAEPALAYVKRGGHLASISGIASADKCAAAGVTCTQIRGTAPGMTAGESLRAIARLAEEGKYTPRVTKIFPLAQAAAAQQAAHVGDSVGKVVLIVDPKAKDR